MSEENKVTGTITLIGEPQEVSGGKYRKLTFVVNNNDGYKGAEKILAFELFEKSDEDKIEKFRKYNKVGALVDVKYEIRCNENKGRYFTSLSAWSVFKAEAADSPADEALEEEPPF